jgi:hypothetical protein
MSTAASTRPRALPAASSLPWGWLAFAVLVVAAVVGFLVYPTYPNYDSYYSMLWGRELLDGHLPVYETYRAPTPHPLATLVGAVIAPLGHGAERVWIALCVIAFVALVVGVYKLAKEAFTPLVGLVAGALICTRFDFPFYAARGYLDIAYMALVVWAAVLEARSSRRGTPVLVLLALAGMLRPEAWLISGLYFLWVAYPASWADRVKYALLTGAGALVWVLSDLAVTGELLYSLTYTSNFAEELGRSKSGGDLPAAMWAFLVKLDKFPVLLGGIVGLCLAVTLVPRRTAVPVALLGVGIGTFLILGLAGFSVIDRYLLVTSLVVMVFAAVAIAGWTMLERGRWRTAWTVAALLLVAYGVVFTATRVNLSRLDNELTFRGTAHAALHDVLDDPKVRAGLRCGPVNVPNHKLIPDIRWIADLPDGEVLARSEAIREVPDDVGPAERARQQRQIDAVRRRIEAGGVQIIPNQRLALFRSALVSDADDPVTVLPLPGYERVAVSDYYAAYVRC